MAVQFKDIKEGGDSFFFAGGEFKKITPFEDSGCYNDLANALIISPVTEDCKEDESPTPAGELTHFPDDQLVELTNK